MTIRRRHVSIHQALVSCAAITALGSLLKKVILTLPAYNEAQGIGPLLLEADRVFVTQPCASEIVVVDDGSVDGTAEAAQAVQLRTPLSVVKHSQNKGLGQAVITCLKEGLARIESEQDLIVCMDSDNTHPPAVIPEMVRQAAQGADLIIASRYQQGSRQIGVPFFRRMLSLGARWVFWWKLRLPGVRDYTCGFRAYRAWLVRKGFEEYGDQLITRQGFACTDELLVKLANYSHRIIEVPFILRYDRKHGRSKIQLMKTIRETLRMLSQKTEVRPPK